MSSERIPAALPLLEQEYEILRELGRGGTAVVYLARERATGAEVAIKLIRAKYIEDDEALARLAREARFLEQLDHPNVVPVRAVRDLGDAGLALVMAHVEGRTLKELIKEQHPLPPERVEQLFRDIAAALGAAHALGIIHRDVKPENVFVDADGRALLADFGVARSISGDSQLTMIGVAIGTPAYMAPEQIDGGELDGRGDIYSLGLVGWEMLTGHRPWEGETLYAILYHQRHHALPDVRDMRPDVSDRFADVIAVAIEKEPAARWQSVEELFTALDGGEDVARSGMPIPFESETVRFVRPLTPAPEPPQAVSPIVLPATGPRPGEVPDDAPEQAALTTEPAAPFVLPWDRARFEHELAAEPPVRTVDRRRRFALAGAALALLATLGVISSMVAGRREAASMSPLDTSFTQNASSGEIGRSTPPPVFEGRDSVAAQGLGNAIPESLSVEAVLSRELGTLPAPTVPGGAVPPEQRRDDTPDAPLDAPLGVTLGPPRASPARGAAPAASPPAEGPSAQQSARPFSQPAPPPSTTTSPPTAAPRNEPVADFSEIAVPARAARVSIVTGGVHTCLIDAEGRAFCWGGNGRGQLGIGAAARSAAPAAVGSDLRFTMLAPGLSHSCAIARGGSAWCWGENDRGQLGDRSSSARASPVRVANGLSFRAIAAGAAHTCALSVAGEAWCWGAANEGQLGDGGSTDRTAPVRVAGGMQFTTIDVGWNFSCALRADGRAMCWGENGSGQLGDGTTASRRVPTPVQGNIAFTSVTAGSAHACGLTASGDAYCWGRNSAGEIGDGTTSAHSRPSRVRVGTRLVSIAAGAVHTCAVDAEGEAWCWGRNTYGQLGNGGTSDRVQPTRVAGGHTFASVRAFGSHTCGATVAGEAFCWGYNQDGQLGDGTRTHRTRPVYVDRPGG